MDTPMHPASTTTPDAGLAPDTIGIKATDVTVTYRNGHTALYDASFEIPRGTITALVGVNGAGKSTLFKAIMGFVPAAQGQITLLGKTVKQALRENLVAYVPQSEEVDWAFPVLVQDVVMMGRYGHMGFLRRPKAADHAAVDDALRRVVFGQNDAVAEVVTAIKRARAGLGQPPDRRAVRRAAQAGLSGARLGAERAGDPAGRTLYRRRREDRGPDHRPAARVARRRTGDAGVDA